MNTAYALLARLDPDRYDPVLPASDFDSIVNIPAQKVGDYELEHRILEADKRLDMLSGGWVRFDADIIIQILKHKDSTWMSNTPSEVQDMRSLTHWARGHVLVAGLGMGIVVSLLAADDEVESITAVEIVPEVIQIVAPHLDQKVNVIEADFRTWVQSQDEGAFDYIILDIWGDISTDELHDMLNLVITCREALGEKIDVAVWGIDHLFYRLAGEVSGYGSFYYTAEKLEEEGFTALADDINMHWCDDDLEEDEDPDDYIEDALRDAFFNVYGIDV